MELRVASVEYFKDFKADSNLFVQATVGFHELTKVAEQAAKHTEVTRLRLEVHGCRYEVYILYSLLLLSLVNNLS